MQNRKKHPDSFFYFFILYILLHNVISYIFIFFYLLELDTFLHFYKNSIKKIVGQTKKCKIEKSIRILFSTFLFFVFCYIFVFHIFLFTWIGYFFTLLQKLCKKIVGQTKKCKIEKSIRILFSTFLFFVFCYIIYFIYFYIFLFTWIGFFFTLLQKLCKKNCWPNQKMQK